MPASTTVSLHSSVEISYATPNLGRVFLVCLYSCVSCRCSALPGAPENEDQDDEEHEDEDNADQEHEEEHENEDEHSFLHVATAVASAVVSVAAAVSLIAL